MSRQIKLEIIEETGTTALGVIKAGEVRVGREPGNTGIAIDRDGISRVHGMFVRLQSHWLYRDNGSTNGSWVNGRKIEENKWAIVRGGSIVQLADVGIRILESGDGAEQQSLKNFPALGGRCVLVFRHGDFIEEYPVPEYGKALTIGGSAGDLEIEGDLADAPGLVIERRGDTVVCYSVEKRLPVFVDGQQIDETKIVTDGVEVEIGEYSILYNDPGYTSMNATQAQGAAVQTSTYVRGWDEERDRVSASEEAKVGGSQVFGTGGFDPTAATVEGDFSESGYDPGSTFTGRRTSAFNQPAKQTSYASLEERIILGVGLCVVFAVMMLLIWWLIQ